MNPRPDTVAQVRGVFVGSLSGAVSIAAHAVGGGGTPPSGAAVVLLLTVCAVIGAAISTIRVSRREFVFDAAVLVAGQALGHATLMLAAEHTHGLGLSAPMIGAHVLATVVAAILLRGAERACLAVIAALVEIVRAIVAWFPAECRVWISTPVYRATLSLWLLAGSAVGTRAPPWAVKPSALAVL
jgi:hypothetical protein